MSILAGLSKERLKELGEIVGVDPELLSPEIPKGREMEWYDAHDAREEAKLIEALKKN